MQQIKTFAAYYIGIFKNNIPKNVCLYCLNFLMSNFEGVVLPRENIFEKTTNIHSITYQFQIKDFSEQMHCVRVSHYSGEEYLIFPNNCALNDKFFKVGMGQIWLNNNLKNHRKQSSRVPCWPFCMKSKMAATESMNLIQLILFTLQLCVIPLNIGFWV